MRQTNIQKLTDHARKCGVHFSAEDKAKYHRLGRAVLKDLADQIGTDERDIRSCKGGPAVLGEVILHTPHIYIMIGGLNPSQVMYRTVDGMKDYRGGTNRWATFDMIESGMLAKLCRNLKSQSVAA